MRVALDTSVVVAALIESHPRHAEAQGWLSPEPGGDDDLVASWHAYAEAWSVLTAMPMVPRIPGHVAKAALDRLSKRVRLIAPSRRIYSAAALRCAERGLRSGAIYDALHVATAEHASADVLLTLNLRDFERLVEPDGPRVRGP